MPMTLIEASKIDDGNVVRGPVIEMFARGGDLLRVMPFMDVAGGSYSYTQEGSLPGVAFRAFNEAYAESTGVINPQVEVLRIDPSKQGRFLSLFQERKHLAFYFPDRPRPLNEVEKKSLRDLIKPTWLDDGERRTRFLVVSNVEDSSKGSLKRAEGRSWNVIDAIAEISRDIQPIEPPPENLHESVSETPRRAAASGKGNHILLAAASRTTILPSGRTPSAAPVASPPGAAAGTQLGSESTAASPDGAAKDIVRKGRVLNWIFPFSVPGETLRPEDRPNVKLDDKLARSVWVYRVDC